MKTSPPLISIGIPSYNRPTGLKRTIESVLKQTYKNLEIIISDNSSNNPEVEKVAKDFLAHDDRIRFYKNETNIGATLNFAKVFNYSKGEYFMWLADDDWLSENFIEKAYHYHVNNPGFSIVAPSPCAVTENKKKYFTGISFLDNCSFHRCIKSYNVLLLTVIYGLIKRSYLEKIIIENKFGIDRLIDASLAFLGKIKSLEDSYLYRSAGSSSSTNKYESHKGMMKSLNLKYHGLLSARISLSYNAAKDIFKQKKVFGSKSIFYKIILAILCFIISFKVSLSHYYFKPIKKKIAHFKHKTIVLLLAFINRIKWELNRKKLKIAIWGWWEGNNLGDIWIKDTMSRIFHNVQFIHSEHNWNFRKFRFVIIGGGGLFIREVKPKIKNINVPYGAIGLGSEFDHKTDQTKKFADKAKFFFVRDEYSANCMKLTQKNISYDLTFYFPLEPLCDIEYSESVLFIWRDPISHTNFKDFKDYIGTIESKDIWEKKVENRFKIVKQNDFHTSINNIEKLTADVGFIISARYHGIVAAIQRNIPCIGIDMCPKIRALMEESGLSEYCIKYHEIDKLDNLISKALNNIDLIIKTQKQYTVLANNKLKQDIAIINKIIYN